MGLSGMAEDSGCGAIIGAAGVSMGVGEPMFDTMGRAPRTMFTPDPEEMAEQMRRIQVEKRVTLRGVCVRTYDLGVPEQVKAYESDLRMILEGVTAKTHAVLAKPPIQFVADAARPRYVAHLEWLEFELHQKPVRPVGGGRKGADDEHEQACRGNSARAAGANGAGGAGRSRRWGSDPHSVRVYE